MKKIIVIISLLISGIIIYSCSKEDNNVLSNKSNISVNNTKSNMVSYDIPDDCKADRNYKGEILVCSEVLTAVINDVTYEGTLYAESDTNGYLIYVSYSDVMSNAFGLKTDVLFDEDIHAMLLDAINSNNKGFFGKVWGAIKYTFWGEPKQQPCFMGRTNKWIKHWLVGIHSMQENVPC